MQNWNDKVREDDAVYVLGNIFYEGKNKAHIETSLQQLKGRMHLIVGNHDSSWMEVIDTSRYFLSVNTLLETSLDGFGMILCHYPKVTWRHQAKSFMVHGHIHNDTKMMQLALMTPRNHRSFWHLGCRSCGQPIRVPKLIPPVMQEKHAGLRQNASKDTHPSPGK